jgi:hypothetical protein
LKESEKIPHYQKHDLRHLLYLTQVAITLRSWLREGILLPLA